MNRFYFFLTICILLLFSFVQAFAKNESSFLHKGSVIHPRIIQEFERNISDSRPSTIAVDLEAAVGSNEYFDDDIKIEDSGMIKVVDTGSSYGYKVIGAVRDKVFVVRTFSWGGGTGVFQSLLFLKMDKGFAYDADGTPYWQAPLRLIWSCPLGDRSSAEVVVVGGKVLVDGKSLRLPFPSRYDLKAEERNARETLRRQYRSWDMTLLKVTLESAVDTYVEDGVISSTDSRYVKDQFLDQLEKKEGSYLWELANFRANLYSEEHIVRIDRWERVFTQILSKYAATQEYQKGYSKAVGRVCNKIINDSLSKTK